MAGIWQNDFFSFSWLFRAFLLGSIRWMAAQEGETRIRVEVDMVQLNVAVMDSKGNYVTGLKPSDFEVTEDGIHAKGCHLRRRQRSHPKSDRQRRTETKSGQHHIRCNGASDAPETTRPSWGPSWDR